MKKLAVMLVCALTVGMFGGCGNKFDAAAYTKAVLDNSYKNDGSGYKELNIGTEEEAAATYEEGLNAVTDSYLYGMNISDEDREEFKAVFADILAGAKYTVGEAVEQEDGSYVVEVSYEQMNVYVPAVDIYMGKVEAMTEEITSLTDEEEIINMMLTLLRESFAESFANVTYQEAATTTITVAIEDNVWMPSSDDLQNLELLLFDAEAANNSLLGE